LLTTTTANITFTGAWQKVSLKINVTNVNTAFVRWFVSNATFGAVTFSLAEPMLSLSYSASLSILNDYAPTVGISGVYYPCLSGGLYYFVSTNAKILTTSLPLDLAVSSENNIFVVIKGTLAPGNSLQINNPYSGIKLTWLGLSNSQLKYLDIATLRLYNANTGSLYPVSQYRLEIINQVPFYLEKRINTVVNPYLDTTEFFDIQKTSSNPIEIIIQNIRKFI